MTGTTNPCQAFFAAQAKNNQKVTLLPAPDIAVEWECLSASEHSPAPIADSEDLIRIVFSPIHTNLETGEITPAVFSDAKDKGLSVQRLTLCSKGEIISQGNARAEAKNSEKPDASPRFVYGTIRIPTNTLRSLFGANNIRQFAAYDTANQDDRAHADVCLLNASDKQCWRSARLQLWNFAVNEFTRLA